jgi:tRNA pseudouridine55 synthase
MTPMANLWAKFAPPAPGLDESPETRRRIPRLHRASSAAILGQENSRSPRLQTGAKEKQVILQPVQVEIKEFDITAVEADRAHFRARVASGTYMRSIAHEMGQRLGCGAHLESLRRTSVAEFDISQAHTLDEIEAATSDARHLSF